jgi:hypothetical protein
MGALLKKKSLRDKAAKKKAAKKKQEESMEKTTKQKKAMFASDPDNAGAEKDKEEVAIKEVAVCFKASTRGTTLKEDSAKRSRRVCHFSVSIWIRQPAFFQVGRTSGSIQSRQKQVFRSIK